MALACAAPAWSDCGPQGAQCGPVERRKDAAPEHMCPVTDKLMEKAHFYLEHADEIGLSEEQTQTIKALQLEATKTSLRQEADMKILTLDMKAKMSEPPLDVKALNEMVEDAFAGIAQSTKAMIGNYAKLRAVLTEEQLARAKEIWKKRS
jgi:hypothetical protein